MSMYLKAFGIHVYLAIIKESYNGKYLEANAKALHVLKSTLNNKYLSRVSNFNSAFIVWNTLISLDEQMQYYKEIDLDEGSDASNMCYMVQGDDTLEVNSDFEVDDDNEVPYDDL